MDVVLCSSAVRCRQTVNEFLKNQQAGSICYTWELEERHMGVLEGCLRSEMASQYPELFCKERFRLFETPPGGESFEAFRSRVRAFWDRYQDITEGTLLICSHNQFLKMLYLIIHDLPVTETQWKKINFPTGTIEKIM